MTPPTPTLHAAGEAEAEQAWQEWKATPDGKQATFIYLSSPMVGRVSVASEASDAFAAGYSAASAQSHARVTRAVSATIESAAKVAKEHDREHLKSVCDYIASEIHALSVPALVAAALAEADHAKG